MTHRQWHSHFVPLPGRKVRWNERCSPPTEKPSAGRWLPRAASPGGGAKSTCEEESGRAAYSSPSASPPPRLRRRRTAIADCWGSCGGGRRVFLLAEKWPRPGWLFDSLRLCLAASFDGSSLVSGVVPKPRAFAFEDRPSPESSPAGALGFLAGQQAESARGHETAVGNNLWITGVGRSQ